MEEVTCDDLVVDQLMVWGDAHAIRARWERGGSPVVRRHLRRMDLFWRRGRDPICDGDTIRTQVIVAMVTRDLSAAAGGVVWVTLEPGVPDEWTRLSWSSDVAPGPLYADYDRWLRKRDWLRSVPFGTLTFEMSSDKVALVVDRLGPDGQQVVDRYEGTWKPVRAPVVREGRRQ